MRTIISHYGGYPDTYRDTDNDDNINTELYFLNSHESFLLTCL